MKTIGIREAQKRLADLETQGEPEGGYVEHPVKGMPGVSLTDRPHSAQARLDVVIGPDGVGRRLLPAGGTERVDTVTGKRVRETRRLKDVVSQAEDVVQAVGETGP